MNFSIFVFKHIASSAYDMHGDSCGKSEIWDSAERNRGGRIWVIKI